VEKASLTPKWIFIRILVAVLTGISVSWSAVVANQGYLGGGSVPSARILPAGTMVFFGQNLASDAVPVTGAPQSGQFQGGLLGSPLDWLEVGGVLHRSTYSGSSDLRYHGDLALKIQVPRFDSLQPMLSFGVYDLAENSRRWQNIYFVGGYEFKSRIMRLGFDLGAIYQRKVNPFDTASRSGVTSFQITEVDLGKVSMMLENTWRQEHFFAAPSLWIKPWAKGNSDSDAGLQFGGGTRVELTHITKYPKAWGEVSMVVPLGRFTDTSRAASDTSVRQVSAEPFVWIDLNPIFDHSLGAGAKQYRAGLDLQSALRFGLRGFYWVNGATLPIMDSKDQSRLILRSAWDRSYLLFTRADVFKAAISLRTPQVGVGLLQHRTFGIVWWQEFQLGFWAPSRLMVAKLVGDMTGNALVLRQPLHPKLPWVFSQTSLYAEGGLYPDQQGRAYVGLAQGSERNHLDVAGGYDIYNRGIIVRAELKLNLSSPFAKQVGPVQISALNRVEHRFEDALSGTRQGFVTSLDGNSKRQFHSIPWDSRAWAGDSMRAVAKVSNSVLDPDGDGIVGALDQCPNEPEDFDGFEDSDGCPDLDNDHDGIPDALDRCPMQAEDMDGFDDSDGCPDFDNDKDGIPDSLDACPNAPEDFDGFEDSDGCPDPDNDHDGVADIDDRCPLVPGVIGTNMERMGCPAVDDQDGIPYEQDACPDQPEDFDGYEDWDGCPDLDNDHDGVPDALDKCPNEPEIMDGIHDGDGCP